MATLTTDIDKSDRGNGFFSRFLNALGRGIEAHGRKASRRDEIEALEAKSDADLARMGLRREDIVLHVFRNLYYT